MPEKVFVICLADEGWFPFFVCKDKNTAAEEICKLAEKDKWAETEKGMSLLPQAPGLIRNGHADIVFQLIGLPIGFKVLEVEFKGGENAG